MVQCRLKTFPLEFKLLNKIKELDFGWNALTALPTSLQEFKELGKLIVFDNQLKSIAESIIKLPQLTHILAFNNPLDENTQILLKKRKQDCNVYYGPYKNMK